METPTGADMPFRNSLKFKFTLLLLGFVMAIGLILWLHFLTARRVSNELWHVEKRDLPFYAAAYTLSVTYEDIRDLMEAELQDRDSMLPPLLEEYREDFERLLDSLAGCGNDSQVQQVTHIRELFEGYLRSGGKLPAQKPLEASIKRLFTQSTFEVYHSLNHSRNQIDRQMSVTLLVGVAAFLVLFGFLLFLSRRIILPIQTLSSMTTEVAAGNFKLGSAPSQAFKDEVGELARSFERMKQGLQKSMVSKSYVDNIIRSMGNALIVLDHQFKIVRMNTAASKMLGYASASPAKGTMDPFFGGSFQQWCEEERVPELAMISRRELELRTFKGTVIPVLFSCSVLRGKTRSVEGYVCVAQDITELKKAEEALEQQAEDLLRSNQELEQFAYVASHDLQEPLRMVTSYLQLLNKRYGERLGEEGGAFLKFAVDGALRMQELIHDLLSYSRLGRNREWQPGISLGKVVSETLELLRGTIEETGAEVRVGSLPTLSCDAGQLGQLFQNLIGNALKYRGEAAPRLEISAERQAAEWVFCIRDNGIGIGEEYLHRIFEIFQRLHTKEAYPGTGIGLAICKKIVESHGGRIWARSEFSRGAAFYFTLPVSLESKTVAVC